MFSKREYDHYRVILVLPMPGAVEESKLDYISLVDSIIGFH